MSVSLYKYVSALSPSLFPSVFCLYASKYRVIAAYMRLYYRAAVFCVEYKPLCLNFSSDDENNNDEKSLARVPGYLVIYRN